MTALGRVGIIVTDIQGDFTTYHEGSLAVPDTDAIYVVRVNQATKELYDAGFPVFATQDWHTENHVSFYTNHTGAEPFQDITLPDGRTQTLWPPHCVEDSPGADLLLDSDHVTYNIHKATDPDYESYSAFADEKGTPTELDALLRKEGVTTVVIYGLATDRCVMYTALDAVKAGYRVVVIKELCRGIKPESTEAALKEMKDHGVQIMEVYSLDKFKEY
jgi:nicotinamidase/pyrazinamidase